MDIPWFDSWQEQEIYLSLVQNSLAVGPQWVPEVPPPGVKWLQHDGDHLPQSSADFMYG